jgi:hypothetical protein
MRQIKINFKFTIHNLQFTMAFHPFSPSPPHPFTNPPLLPFYHLPQFLHHAPYILHLIIRKPIFIKFIIITHKKTAESLLCLSGKQHCFQGKYNFRNPLGKANKRPTAA